MSTILVRAICTMIYIIGVRGNEYIMDFVDISENKFVQDNGSAFVKSENPSETIMIDEYIVEGDFGKGVHLDTYSGPEHDSQAKSLVWTLPSRCLTDPLLCQDGLTLMFTMILDEDIRRGGTDYFYTIVSNRGQDNDAGLRLHYSFNELISRYFLVFEVYTTAGYLYAYAFSENEILETNKLMNIAIVYHEDGNHIYKDAQSIAPRKSKRNRPDDSRAPGQGSLYFQHDPAIWTPTMGATTAQLRLDERALTPFDIDFIITHRFEMNFEEVEGNTFVQPNAVAFIDSEHGTANINDYIVSDALFGQAAHLPTDISDRTRLVCSFPSSSCAAEPSSCLRGMTIMARLKTDANLYQWSYSSYYTIFSSRDDVPGGSAGFELGYQYNTDTSIYELSFGAYTATGGSWKKIRTLHPIIDPGADIYFALTYIEHEIKLYIDGHSLYVYESGSDVQVYSSGSDSISFLNDNHFSNDFTLGATIYEIIFWDKVLTSAEINSNTFEMNFESVKDNTFVQPNVEAFIESEHGTANINDYIVSDALFGQAVHLPTDTSDRTRLVCNYPSNSCVADSSRCFLGTTIVTKFKPHADLYDLIPSSSYMIISSRDIERRSAGFDLDYQYNTDTSIYDLSFGAFGASGSLWKKIRSNTPILQPGVVIYLAVTSTEDETKVYVDGQIMDVYESGTDTQVYVSGLDSLFVLNDYQFDHLTLAATIYEITVYERALSAAEINSLI